MNLPLERGSSYSAFVLAVVTFKAYVVLYLLRFSCSVVFSDSVSVVRNLSYSCVCLAVVASLQWRKLNSDRGYAIIGKKNNP